MKLPRISIAAVGFVVAVLALDLGVLRAVATMHAGADVSWFEYGLLLVPMIDALMIALFQMRWPERRTAGRVGFVIGGTLAIAATFAIELIAPEAQLTMAYTVIRPFETWAERALAALLGAPLVTFPRVVEFAFCFVFQAVIPGVVFFSGPALVVARLGAWIGRRYPVGAAVNVGPLTA